MENDIDLDKPRQSTVAADSYVLPIAAHEPQNRASSGYLQRLSRQVDDVIVVDGSPEETFRLRTH